MSIKIGLTLKYVISFIQILKGVFPKRRILALGFN